MSKRVFGLNEFIILAALLGMLALLTIRFVNPELLDLPFFNTQLGSFIGGCFFCYFTRNQFKAAKFKEEWGPNRVAGIIRVPLYFAVAVFLFYVAATGGLNA